jgi:hypothetical protein
MDKRYLKNNHDEDVVEKRRNENYIKYKYQKCTYLWIEIRSAVMKSSSPRAFRHVVMTVVAVIVAPFFAAIIIATWSGGRGDRSSAEPLETWSTWSVVDVIGARRAARDVVGAQQSRSGRGRRGPWLMWSELGGVGPRTKTCGRSASYMEV